MAQPNLILGVDGGGTSTTAWLAQASHPDAVEHPIVAEVHPLEFRTKDGDWWAFFDGSYKLLWNDQGDHGLFDLAADPKEERNLFSEDAETAQRMEQALHGYLQTLPEPPAGSGESVEVDVQTREALRNLGYVR